MLSALVFWPDALAHMQNKVLFAPTSIPVVLDDADAHTHARPHSAITTVDHECVDVDGIEMHEAAPRDDGMQNRITSTTSPRPVARLSVPGANNPQTGEAKVATGRAGPKSPFA